MDKARERFFPIQVRELAAPGPRADARLRLLVLAAAESGSSCELLIEQLQHALGPLAGRALAAELYVAQGPGAAFDAVGKLWLPDAEPPRSALELSVAGARELRVLCVEEC